MRKGGRYLASQPDKKGKIWLTVLVILLAVVLLVGALGAVAPVLIFYVILEINIDVFKSYKTSLRQEVYTIAH